MNKKIVIGCFVALLTLLILQIPVRQHRVLSYGVDTYNAHRPLYESTTLQQNLISQDTITGIGAILVDLRRSRQLTDTHVLITDTATGETLVSNIISKEDIQDDRFAYTSFPDTPIPRGRTIQILFSSPDATFKNATGIRINPENKNLALALQERVPLWKAIITTIQNKSDAWTYVLLGVLASFIVAVPVLIHQTYKPWVITIGIIIIIATGIRILSVPHFGGVSGGDAYNYLYTSKAISEFKNPLANTKRLPGYPLMLTPFYASGIFDDHDVMRFIQIIASIVGILLLIGIARTLNLSWPTAVATSAILAFQKDYFFTSLRPEPYTLYTALLLSSLLLFFVSYKNNKLWVHILFGLSLGYAAMVRQEGFVLAAVLGVCSVVYEIYTGRSFKRFVLMYAPALCAVLPFFVHNTLTYGHPLYTEYFEGDRLQIVDSYMAFQDSLGATWGVMSSMWKPSWDSLERFSITSPLFILSVGALWAWYIALKQFAHKIPTAIITTGISCVWLFLVLSSVYASSSLAGTIPIITAAWILASIPLFLIETRWKGVVIFLVCLSQILIATWFHPFPKHYQQSYPLIILMIATAAVSTLPSQKRILSSVSIATFVFPFLIIAVNLSQNFNAEIDRYNANTALDSVTYRAARFARTLPGPIGFDQAYLPARLYFDPDAKYFPDEEHPTPEMEQEWLEKTPVKTMVVTNGNNVFKKIPDSWKKIKDFKAAGNDEKIFVSTIYAIPF